MIEVVEEDKHGFKWLQKGSKFVEIVGDSSSVS